MILVDICGNFPWFWLIFGYPDPFHWSGSGSTWPKLNGSGSETLEISINRNFVDVRNFRSYAKFRWFQNFGANPIPVQAGKNVTNPSESGSDHTDQNGVLHPEGCVPDVESNCSMIFGWKLITWSSLLLFTSRTFVEFRKGCEQKASWLNVTMSSWIVFPFLSVISNLT